MGVFARTLCTAAAFAVLAGLPAMAQFFPYPPPPPPGYPPPPPPIYQQRPYAQPQPYYQPRRQPPGYTCQTRRISCDLDDPRPLGSSCNCFVPGFGYRGGQVTP